MENPSECNDRNEKLMKNIATKLDGVICANNNNNNNNNSDCSRKMLENDLQQQKQQQQKQQQPTEPNATRETTTTTAIRQRESINKKQLCGSCGETAVEVDGSGDNNDDSNIAMACAARVEDEGGGGGIGGSNAFHFTTTTTTAGTTKLNGSGTMAASPVMAQHKHHTHVISAQGGVGHDDYEEEAACAMGAVSLTPPPPLNTPGAVNHSNRTSLNNSTENLSYSSDNYYPDDLILLDDEDVDADEILSLNSDDCVYAYRGDGAEFDIALQAIAGGRGGAIGVMGADGGLVDDETDFLEMDFEPDPPSEVEYGLGQPSHGHHHHHGHHSADGDAFLMQRDSCHLSGRHSANMLGVQTSSSSSSAAIGGVGSLQQQRQLFSSPIDDDDDDDDDDLLIGPSASKPGLQSQLLMSKNFARITMHLDQIKGEAADCDLSYERTPNERSLSGSSRERDLDVLATTSETAHSLPNTLLTDYHRDSLHAPEHELKTSPSKVTGAKPKRLSTHSTSSSQSSKNSSKSRTSLRSSAFTQSGGVNALGGHFDERSVSCTEFRSIPPLCSTAGGPSSISVDADECGGVGVSGGVGGGGVGLSSGVSVVVGKPLAKNLRHDDFSAYEEGCLDCLENEFLAKTVGKVVDPKGCPRCQRRRHYGGHSNQQPMFMSRTEVVQRRHSKTFLDAMSANDQIFYQAQSRALAQLQTSAGDKETGGGGGGGATGGGFRLKKKEFPLAKMVVHDVDVVKPTNDERSKSIENDPYNFYKTDQRRTMCDSYNEDLLLQSLLLTEPEIATISTININEDTLVQALDNFNIPYNADLLRAHFKSYYATAANPQQSRVKDFKNLKHFLLHESKKYNNHPRLKRLIEMATGEQVNVDFQRDTNITEAEMVLVKVSDVIHQWSRNKNLEILKQLDKRFADANVLGKIANIIRQTQQRCSRSRPLPEFISIPQYYPSGFLTLTKKMLNVPTME